VNEADRDKREREEIDAREAKTLLENPLILRARSAIRDGLYKALVDCDPMDHPRLTTLCQAAKLEPKYFALLTKAVETGQFASKALLTDARQPRRASGRSREE